MKRGRLFRLSMDVVRKQRRTMILCALLLSVAAVMTARSHVTKTATVEATTSSAVMKLTGTKTISSSFVKPEGDHLARLLVTLRPTGFDPSEVTLPQGQFLLAVDNKTGLNVVRLRLSREDGDRSADLALSSGRHKWREKVNLPAGTYWLTASGHPNWRCRITVAP